ncbi:hypothetical protein [Streptomyces sp. SID3343]|uniref:hypothetical protein n=1 Tax=Streptomyces sp. SID3343 TaxID=2690260 RepID=UPI00136FB11E|nr:hypothetical protein [Streptomyces sp. SID3343]MYW00334.1 hypothetical protein [Streptomyces sp. SID3343]
MSALLALFALVVIARVLATWKLSTRHAATVGPAGTSGTSRGSKADRALAA